MHLTGIQQGASEQQLDTSYAPVEFVEEIAPASYVSVSEGSLDVRRYGVAQDGSTDDTAAFQAAVNALPANGGSLRLPPSLSTIELSAPIDLPKDGVEIVGSGRASRIAYRADGDVFDLTARRDCAFGDFRVTHYGSIGSVVDLSNSFRNSFRHLKLDGMHYNNPAAPGTPSTGQRGFDFRDNAGDNRVIDCDINNFGAGIESSAIMNFVVGCTLGTNYNGILGSGADSGMQVVATSFTSALVESHTTPTYLSQATPGGLPIRGWRAPTYPCRSGRALPVRCFSR